MAAVGMKCVPSPECRCHVTEPEGDRLTCGHSIFLPIRFPAGTSLLASLAEGRGFAGRG